MIPNETVALTDVLLPPNVTHIGIIPVNLRGHVLVTEPRGHPYGVSATFSKLKPLKHEATSRTLMRCLETQVGQRAISIHPILHIWVTDNSASFYFAALLDNRGEPPSQTIEGLSWCSIEKAEAQIGASKNLSSRRRDLGLLTVAQGMCLSIPRRVLLMVNALHRRGFERLRAQCFMHSNMGGCHWSCEIVPSICASLENSGLINGDADNGLYDLLGWHQMSNANRAGESQNTFGWHDAVFDTPGELADRFLGRHSSLACTGWGPDPAYARWLDQVLEMTAPHGAFYPLVAHAEFVRSAFTAEDLRLPPAPPPIF